MAQDTRAHEKVQQFYGKDAISYDAARWLLPAGQYNNRVQQEIVTELLGPFSGERVLEVAVGTGRFTSHLAARGARMTGLDIALPMLRRARASMSSAGVDGAVGLLLGDARRLPLADASFDACLCVNALHHMPGAAASIAEMSMVIKPAGRIVFNFTNRWSLYLPMALAVNWRHRSLRKDVYTRWLDLTAVEQMCDRAGLSIVAARGHLHIPTRVSGPLLWLLIKADRSVRRGGLRLLAPSIYVRVQPRR